MDDCCHIQAFLTEEERSSLLKAVRSQAPLLKETGGRAGLGPRYRIIDGEKIGNRMPALVAFGENRLRPFLERMAGQSLRLMASPKRSLRVQVYAQKCHGFRWHFDGHAYAAVVTLENSNRGQTQVISGALSRWLRPLYYALYPLPQLLGLVPFRRITAQAGDVLFMRGDRLLHRGVTLEPQGERVLIAYAYDEAGRKPNPLRDRLARWLNY